MAGAVILSRGSNRKMGWMSRRCLGCGKVFESAVANFCPYCGGKGPFDGEQPSPRGVFGVGSHGLILFRVKADAEFEADGIDDAFRKLAGHFIALADGEDSDALCGGEISIGPAVGD